jgi:hypothetical protein
VSLFETDDQYLVCRTTAALATDGECVDHRASDCLVLSSRIAQAPHCDQRILHSRGVCEYCDRYPDRQAIRLANRILCTNEDPQDGWRACPAIEVRGKESCEYWPGNRPS